MKNQTIVLDIETLPADASKYKKLTYLYGKKEKEEGFKKKNPTLEDFITHTSFDGSYGRVLCICYSLDGGPVQTIYNGDDEKKNLEDFWKVCETVFMFVGHNIIDFDMRFLVQRSIILGVKPDLPPKFSFAKYRTDSMFDTMKQWTQWGSESKSLEHVALALDLPTPKDGIDGSQVNAFHLAGKDKEICDYCVRDVETTVEVYKRMNFSE